MKFFPVKGQLNLERSKYDQMISFASKPTKTKRLERSCVQLIELKSTAFSEPVFVICFHLQAGQLLVINHLHCHDGCKGKVCGIEFVRIFMQITSDPMRA